jgi:serine/threonine-protein kinase
VKEAHDTLGVASTLHELGLLAEPAAGQADIAKTLPADTPTMDETGATPSPDSERYEYRGSLGEGGMGVVERAWDSDLMRYLAIKRLKQKFRSDRRSLDQFLWEARVGAHLDHPNIVPVHDLGLSKDGEVYFTMKHVEGKTLAGLIAELRGEQEMPMAARLRLFLQLCNAIDFAHSRGVVHRDLKPANIMLGQHGEVFVMDWGIARPSRESDTRWMKESWPEFRETLSGTPLYMSPEQARGEEVDARSDIYGLGAILYELASLHCAFEGDSVTEVLEKVKSGNRPPLLTAYPEAGSSLAAVVERAMALDASERYESVSSMASDIEQVLDGRTPEAESTSLARRAGRYFTTEDRARMRPIDLDSLILAGGLVGAAGGSWLASTLGGWEWLLLIAAALVGISPALQWLRTTGK